MSYTRGGVRRVTGAAEARAGLVGPVVVGMPGFEPGASASQRRRANQTAPHPGGRVVGGRCGRGLPSRRRLAHVLHGALVAAWGSECGMAAACTVAVTGALGWTLRAPHATLARPVAVALPRMPSH